MTDIHIPAIRLLSGISRLTSESPLLKDLSISIGAITCPGSLNIAPTRLLEAADECLYAAKRSGRSCAFTLDVALSGSNGKPTRLNLDTELDTAQWAAPPVRRNR